jgi:hypothetical protein
MQLREVLYKGVMGKAIPNGKKVNMTELLKGVKISKLDFLDHECQTTRNHIEILSLN